MAISEDTQLDVLLTVQENPHLPGREDLLCFEHIAIIQNLTDPGASRGNTELNFEKL